ncbi:hypothetical protein [Tardiphaga sp.]|jgi:hypothetical protein|uniref:hypothetical protein n=1 Tax=Tardiphaga sp. TaxID=1926292 RepID=UPI0019B82B70|nr:hypothetical protein [Tardiphaga sp.]MBC7577025.1 hypothetical protein [Tardiphaga sp.]
MAGSYHTHHESIPGSDGAVRAHAPTRPFAALLRLRAWMSSPREHHHNDDVAPPRSERAFVAHLLAQLGHDYEVRRQKSRR